MVTELLDFTRMEDVLSLQIEDQHAAVGVPVLQVDSNLVELVQEDLLAWASRGTTLDSTEMQPEPPMERTGTIWSSLPE